mmetsp:Transcript_25828/g.76662  ORF Transcript_25828/g.76662 Transcript_25828/m.76662 type:complete len:275 (+) Transcript_25828:1459-2283(+)
MKERSVRSSRVLFCTGVPMCRRYRGTLSCVVRASGGGGHSHLSCVRVVTVSSLGGGLEAKKILVLHGGAREQDPLRRAEARKPLVSRRLSSLDRVRLVEHAAPPLPAAEPAPVHHVGLALPLEVRVRGQDNIEALRVQVRLHRVPLRARAVVLCGAKRRAPRGELARPVVQHRRGSHDKVRARTVGLVQRREQCDNLHGLAEAHLVGEDASQAKVVHHPEPVEPDHLVAGELFPRRQACRLVQQLAAERPRGLRALPGEVGDGGEGQAAAVLKH